MHTNEPVPGDDPAAVARRRLIDTLSPFEMRLMLQYLSGYTPQGFDAAVKAVKPQAAS